MDDQRIPQISKIGPYPMWRWIKMNVLGLPDYEGFARGVARIRENCERDGIDFAPLAKIAEDIVDHSTK